MGAGTKTKIRWDGPTQQVCYPLARHGYKAILTPGQVYEVPSEFAAALLRSSRYWSPVTESGPARRKEPSQFGLTGKIESIDTRPARKGRRGRRST